MAWALVTIRLCWAWRKISVRRTCGTLSDSMKSRSTLPGPTEGSWSLSPTRISRQFIFKAQISERISGMSTIEVSSTMTAPALSGFFSLRLNCSEVGLAKSVSSRRWMVLASRPVTSDIRLAARPVGAHSATLQPDCSSRSMMALMVVVLPVPGPPVRMKILCCSACRMASFCRPA